MRQAKHRTIEIRPKAVGSGIFAHIVNFDKWRSEAGGDVVSGVAVGQVGVYVRAAFGESELNSGRII